MATRKYRESKLQMQLFGRVDRVIKDVAFECFADIPDEILESAVNALKIPEADHDHDADLEAKDTKEKIRINDFSPDVVRIIMDSAVCFTQIQRYIKERDKGERKQGFRDNFRAYFRSEYQKLVLRGLSGDDVFHAIVRHFEDKFDPAKRLERYAITPIISYLFVICDLFCRTDEEVARERSAT